MGLKIAAMLARGLKGGKRAGLAVLAMCLSTSAALAAAAPVCPPSRTPIKLSFTTRVPDPVYNNRLPIPALANLLRSRGFTPDPQTRGLTLTNSKFLIKGKSAIAESRGGACVYVTDIEVEFGWDRVEVYVPSDFVRGSCQYNVVLDHENQHVSINRAVLKEFAPRIRAGVETSLAEMKPIFTRNPNGALDGALDTIQAQVSGLMREFESVQNRRNDVIDNPANYKALAGMCKGWDGTPPTAK